MTVLIRPQPGLVAPLNGAKGVIQVKCHNFLRARRPATRDGPLGPETYELGERQYSVLDFAGHLSAFTRSVADVHPTGLGR